jgi:hypothetical protein
MSPLLSTALQTTNDLKYAATKAHHQLLLAKEALLRLGLQRISSVRKT